MGYPPQQPPGYGGEYGGGYPPQQPPPGYYGGQQPQSSTPQVLSIIGIICWFCCSPAAIVLGVVAQNQFRAQGRSDTLAKVAWIGGIAFLVLGIIVWIVQLTVLSQTSTH